MVTKMVAKTVTLLSYSTRTRIGEEILLTSNPTVRHAYQVVAASVAAAVLVAVAGAAAAVAAATASVIPSAIAISTAGEEGLAIAVVIVLRSAVMLETLAATPTTVRSVKPPCVTMVKVQPI
jgi:hypothetical protein